MVVKVKVGYNCGCGFLTSKSKEAVSHARSTGHTLTVAGEIRGMIKEEKRRKKWQTEES